MYNIIFMYIIILLHISHCKKYINLIVFKLYNRMHVRYIYYKWILGIFIISNNDFIKN